MSATAAMRTIRDMFALPARGRGTVTGRSRAATGDPGAPFYRRVVAGLAAARIPFMVGGGYAFSRHTGIDRPCRDFDVFVVPDDAPRVLQHFACRGYKTRLAHPHWLGKIYFRGRQVDVIYASGNGLARVDQEWFDHAPRSHVLGRLVRLCPIEEMIWSKAFVMERERFDGADVLHLIRTGGADLDWDRLLRRFGDYAHVLLAHVALFDFAFPGERTRVPERVRRQLMRIFARRSTASARLCRGTLLSRTEYLWDLAHGRRDARRVDHVMADADIAHWTAAARTAPGSPIADRLLRGAITPERAPAKRTNKSRR
jgi:hypothetical protein